MAHTGSAGRVGVLFALLACTAFIITPVSAATKYVEGSPLFSAEVTGVNEFTPGQDATISVILKNSATLPMKQLNIGTIEAEDPPTTAKFVTAGLDSGNSALIVKTDPQMLGDISGNGNAILVKFTVKIPTNATDGEYQLPLFLDYQYPKVIDQEAADVYHFHYNQANVTLPITIRVKPQVKIDVLEAVPDQLSAGSEGYLNLKIRNSGPESGEKASVKLLRSGTSPVIPTDSTFFVGNITSGGILDARFKVSISKDATNQTYPVDVVLTYTNREGETVTTPRETVGIPVNRKTAFSIVSTVPQLPAGSSRTIEVTYRNDGTVTAWKAQARITPHNPVSISDNTAYLGDIKPGQTVVTRYEITADPAADPKEYVFDSTIRFRDALGNSQESDVVPVKIVITPAAAGGSPLPGGVPVLAACILAGILIIAGYFIYKKNQENQ